MSEAGRSERGTTLIEALAVLSIAALIATISFPRVQSLIAQAMFRNSSSAVVAELRTAHAAALRDGTAITFDVAEDGTAFGLNGQTDHRLPQNVVLNLGDASSLTFYPDGTASGGEVKLAGPSRAFAVSVDPEDSSISPVTP